MEFKKLPNQRLGQTMFNFGEWLASEKNVPVNQSCRMADPFHLTDKEFKELYSEFYKKYSQ